MSIEVKKLEDVDEFCLLQNTSGWFFGPIFYSEVLADISSYRLSGNLYLSDNGLLDIVSATREQCVKFIEYCIKKELVAVYGNDTEEENFDDTLMDCLPGADNADNKEASDRLEDFIEGNWRPDED